MTQEVIERCIKSRDGSSNPRDYGVLGFSSSQWGELDLFLFFRLPTSISPDTFIEAAWDREFSSSCCFFLLSERRPSAKNLQFEESLHNYVNLHDSEKGRRNADGNSCSPLKNNYICLSHLISFIWQRNLQGSLLVVLSCYSTYVLRRSKNCNKPKHSSGQYF